MVTLILACVFPRLQGVGDTYLLRVLISSLYCLEGDIGVYSIAVLSFFSGII